MPAPAASLIVRPVMPGDAADCADLLNAIIARGGTTALQRPYSPERLAEAYLTGPAVLCCHVAIDPGTGQIEGFQTLGRLPTLPDGVGDIGTFARVGNTQRGVGSALFAATCACSRALGLTALNAVIRADNVGGLAFYARLGFVDHAVMVGTLLDDGTVVDRIVKRYAL
jgi:L-amino acid N-acyltransferase YncA